MQITHSLQEYKCSQFALETIPCIQYLEPGKRPGLNERIYSVCLTLQCEDPGDRFNLRL
jgi:hypothetical protein